MTKFFTLSEAQLLLPILKELIEEANEELGSYHTHLHTANAEYQKAEEALEQLPKPSSDEAIKLLRNQRHQFQKSIEALNLVQQKYLERLNYWIDRILDYGVVLRDLKEGLLDFPAQKGDLNYFLCWRMGEPDITFWHLPSDGFNGRRSLSSLLEYY